MDSSEEAGGEGASTLVLIQDAEFELHTSRSSIVFLKWGSVEAKGKTRRVVFSTSLFTHAQENSTAAAQNAAVPLVITAPFTSRFLLHCSSGASLLPLLRAGVPLKFEVEFIAPRDEADKDFGFANFQDQVIIQTRLAKLSIRLCAFREDTPTDRCAPETLTPRVLPTVKAPSFKLFDQIDRDAATATSQQRPPSSSHRVSISESFHPQKNGEHRISSLLPLPPRQPTPPQHYATGSCPSSSSSSRRTPSPRVLEPLAAPPPELSVTAAVDNQVEAREVILRLRARRSSQNSVPVKTSDTNDSEPTSPESQLDAKAKAELDEFNALVKTAKMTVAGERSKAKQELEYYKSLLPGQPPVGSSPSGQPLLPQRDEWNNAEAQTSAQTGLPRKPAKLPALPPDQEMTVREPVRSQRQDNNQSGAAVVGSTTNQETSPVKRTPHAKQVTKGPTKPIPAPDAPLRTEKQPLRGGDKAKVVDPSKPKAAVKHAPIVPSKSVSPFAIAKPSILKAAVVASTKPSKQPSKTVRKLAQVSQYEHALDDFDDADPEIDDAPVFDDDLKAQRRQRADEDQDDPMLTMNVPLY